MQWPLRNVAHTAVANGIGIDAACCGEIFDGTTPVRSHSIATNLEGFFLSTDTVLYIFRLSAIDVLCKTSPVRICPSMYKTPSRLSFLDLVLWNVRAKLDYFPDKVTSANVPGCGEPFSVLQIDVISGMSQHRWEVTNLPICQWNGRCLSGYWLPLCGQWTHLWGSIQRWRSSAWPKISKMTAFASSDSSEWLTEFH